MLEFESEVFTSAKFYCTFHSLERYGTVLKSINVFARYDVTRRAVWEELLLVANVFDRGPKENMIGRAAGEGLKTTGPG